MTRELDRGEAAINFASESCMNLVTSLSMQRGNCFIEILSNEQHGSDVQMAVLIAIKAYKQTNGGVPRALLLE